MHLLFSGIYNSHSHFHNPYQKVHPYISRPFFNTPLLLRRHRNIHPCLVTSYPFIPTAELEEKKKESKKASTRQQPQPTSKQAVSSKRRQVPTRRKTNFSWCPLSEVLGTVIHGLGWRNPKNKQWGREALQPRSFDITGPMHLYGTYV